MCCQDYAFFSFACFLQCVGLSCLCWWVFFYFTTCLTSGDTWWKQPQSGFLMFLIVGGPLYSCPGCVGPCVFVSWRDFYLFFSCGVDGSNVLCSVIVGV